MALWGVHITSPGKMESPHVRFAFNDEIFLVLFVVQLVHSVHDVHKESGKRYRYGDFVRLNRGLSENDVRI